MSASRTRVLVPVLLLLVVAVVVAGLLVGRGGGGVEAAEETSVVPTVEQPTAVEPAPRTDDPDAPAPAPDVTRRIEGDPMALGPVDAPVGGRLLRLQLPLLPGLGPADGADGRRVRRAGHRPAGGAGHRHPR